MANLMETIRQIGKPAETKVSEEAVVASEETRGTRSGVTVKRDSWGTTVHDGASDSFPFYKDTARKIGALKHGETAHVKDDTGRSVRVTRKNNHVHIKASDHSNSSEYRVRHSHFAESQIEYDTAALTEEERDDLERLLDLVESGEQLDELSRKTLDSYKEKASKDASDSNRDRARWNKLYYDRRASDDLANYARERSNKSRDRADKRLAGAFAASRKTEGKARVNATEEVEMNEELDLSMFTEEELIDFARLVKLEESGEQLDELSSETLKSYVKKSKTDRAAHRQDLSYVKAAKKNGEDFSSSVVGHKERIAKRSSGISSAAATINARKRAEKMNTEEVEPLDELSKSKLNQYIIKNKLSGTGQDRRKGLELARDKKNGVAKVNATEEVEMNEASEALNTLKAGSRTFDDPMSKTAVIANVIGAINAMQKDDFVKWYEQAMALSKTYGDTGVGDKSASNRASVAMKSSDASSVAKEDAALMFSGEDLTEEFKENATTLFEAAVEARVQERIALLDEAYEAALEEAIEEAVTSLNEETLGRLDAYVDVIAERWLEENAVAIESSLRNEITSDFIGGMKKLFAEHYIDVPEDRVDVLESLADKVEELEKMLTDTLSENVDLKRTVLDYEASIVLESVVDELPLSQQDKFRVMAESVDFTGDVDDYEKKLETIKETYFKKSEAARPAKTNIISESFEGETGTETVSVDPAMSRYAAAIGRTVKK